MLFEGYLDSPILFITDYQRVHCTAEGKVFSDFLGQPLLNAIKKAGLLSKDYSFFCYANNVSSLHNILLTHKAKILVPLGEECLQVLTGLKGISKWQCSIVPATAEFGGRKCLPLYHPEYVMKAWTDHVYLQLGCQKLVWEKNSHHLNIPERKFLINPPLQKALTYLKNEVMTAREIGVDFEFGKGQINTVGFAISRTEAIAIKTLTEDYTPLEYFTLWTAIAEILESSVPKIIQHAATEVTWAARYGIQINHVVHDTMWAMKFLHPELDKGLDNVGRWYTPFPYWKDDNDSWNNIRDWARHLEYNCKDTTATLWAYREQQADLIKRKLDSTFYNSVMKYQPVIQEMCNTGLLVNPASILRLKEDLTREKIGYQNIIDSECVAKFNATINPRSPAQLKKALNEFGMKLPTKRTKGKSEEQESTDKKSLVKLRRKYPKEQILPALIGLSAVNKKLSSYVDFEYDHITNKVHYTLDGCGTETGRWAGYKSSWGTGFNPQTVTEGVKKCFIAEPGTVLVEIDLEKAESYYVAFDGPEPTLMSLLAEGRDIHAYVAGKIYNKDERMVSKLERQLGKKAGHASNYGTGARTFAEMALVEMNYFLEEREAKDILEGYMRTFPGIRRRQQNIKQELYQKRFLKTPLGRERYFYGRMDDSTFREAYAYCPQSTIPDITNCLMLELWEERDYLGLAYSDKGRFLLQVHDSLLLQCDPRRVGEVAEFCKDLKRWHPSITLAGGKLMIPVSVKAGNNWKAMEQVL